MTDGTCDYVGCGNDAIEENLTTRIEACADHMFWSDTLGDVYRSMVAWQKAALAKVDTGLSRDFVG